MEPGKPRNPKTFTKEELRSALWPAFQKLFMAEDAFAFKQPVDPILLGIPDYFSIIKHPMDLSTIRKHLEEGKYQNPWEFIDEVQLMFNNAWLYNRKNTRVYKSCTKVSYMLWNILKLLYASNIRQCSFTHFSAQLDVSDFVYEQFSKIFSEKGKLLPKDFLIGSKRNVMF